MTSKRFDRVKTEVKVADNQQLDINEFMHPRLEEICETLPASLGRWLARPHPVNRLVGRFATSGRIVRTTSLRGYLMLYGLSRMRRWRRSTLRFKVETQRIDAWLDRIAATAGINPALAIEVAQCQRLVKGYGDTHARGLANYETLMSVVAAAGPTLAPAVLRELRDAALADERGDKLLAVLARIRATDRTTPKS